MENQIWKSLSKPPASALKAILAGRLKGKTDINPQWRYKAMTEQFGLCGVGWKYTVDRQWTEVGAEGEVMAYVNVSLYFKDGDKWSDPIPANGGSIMIAKEKFGMHNNDEAFKMAETDALGTAMKKIGVASEVYEGNWDGSKYLEGGQNSTQDARRNYQNTKEAYSGQSANNASSGALSKEMDGVTYTLKAGIGKNGKPYKGWFPPKGSNRPIKWVSEYQSEEENVSVNPDEIPDNF